MSFGEFVLHGWSLCAISVGSKGPLYEGWNTRERAITDAEVADTLDGAGLLHAYSGTCAIDIDHIDAARVWLAARGIDLDAMFRAPDATQISSGRRGHGKLLYRLDEPLVSAKIIEDVAGKRCNIIDFRCAARGGKSVQDVLPDTIHPDTGKPYAWVYGDPLAAHWTCLPAIPAPLLAVWRSLLAPEPSAVPDGNLAAPVGLEALQAMLAALDADCDRETWVKILAAVHWETQGSDDGLALAVHWSAKGLKFAGVEDVETRWRSFSLTRENPITAASLRQSEPAALDEFPDVPPAQASAEAAAIIAAAELTEAASFAERRAALESRLVYVRSADRYYDTEVRDLLLGDHALAHRFTNFAGKKIKVAKMLSESKTKKTVAGMRFHPGAVAIFRDDDGIEYANAFRPSEIEPRPPTPHEQDMIEWLFNRIDEITFRAWLLQFLAHAVQRPGVKIRSCPLVWSNETGNGKSTLMKTIPALLFGPQYSCDVNVDAVEEKFNGFLPTAWHIYLDEFRAGSRADRMAIAAKLKPWITNNTVTVREMRRDVYTMPNRFVMTASSNEADSAPIDSNDRRWAIHELKAPMMTASERRELITDFLDRPTIARAPLLHYFLNYPIEGFDPNAEAIHTAARDDMIEASKTSDIEAIDIAWEEHTGPFVRDICTTQEVQDLCSARGFKPTLHTLGRVLAKMGGIQRRVRVGEGQQRFWIMRNHAHWVNSGEALLAAYLNGEVFLDPLAT